MRPPPTRSAALFPWVAALALVACADPAGSAHPEFQARSEPLVIRSEPPADGPQAAVIARSPAQSTAIRATTIEATTWKALGPAARGYFLAAILEGHVDVAFDARQDLTFNPSIAGELVTRWELLEQAREVFAPRLSAAADEVAKKLRGTTAHQLSSSAPPPGFFGHDPSTGRFRLPVAGTEDSQHAWVEFPLSEWPDLADAQRRASEFDRQRSSLLAKAATAIASNLAESAR